MKNKYLIALLLSFIFCHTAKAQQIFVRGYLFDAYTNQAISGANIFNLSKQSSAPSSITDEEGFFETLSFPFDTLIATCGGYHFYSFKINQEEFSDTLYIPLTPQFFELGQELFEKKIVKIYQDQRYHIIDFFVVEENIIVIGADYTRKKYFIWYLDRSFTKTAELIFDTPRLYGCYKDYLGNTYLIKDNKKIFQFRKKRKTFTFKELINIDLDIFLARMEMLHFQDKKRTFTTMYYDLAGFSYACNIGYFTDKNYELRIFNNIHSEKIYNAIDSIIASHWSLDHWEPHLKPYAVYAPIFQLPRNILVFDCVNAQIYLYNKNLTPIDTIYVPSLTPLGDDPFTAHPKWIFAGKIIQDCDKFYALYHNNGASRFKLDEINYLTGELVRSIDIEHPFPTHIQIANKAIYYLYKTPESSEKNGLFMQWIEPLDLEMEKFEENETFEEFEEVQKEGLPNNKS
ncbi:MAG: hypothetical protein LBH92_02265 [Bacteroidales bacterium]|jgi:hypothetical protein|nr:hypothetical protein [Bacteroidales bacterium]